jgi:hypothetical protein
MALADMFDGRTVIRVISRTNGMVKNATDYLPKSEKDFSTAGRWEMLLSFVEAHPSLYDVEFADEVPSTEADKRGNYTKSQLLKMGIPKLNELLQGYNMSGMPSKEMAIQAILDAQGSK